MPQTMGLEPVQAGRIEALKARHAALSEKIEHEQKHFSVSDIVLHKLKAEKLMLKDEIESELRRVS